MKHFQFTIIILAVLYNSCKEVKRESIRDKIDRGSDLADSGKFGEAIDLYTEAIQVNPRIQLAYFNRGISYMGLHEYLKALNDFDSVIKLQTVNGMIRWKNPDFDNSVEAAGQVQYHDVLYQSAIARAEIDSFHSAFSILQYLINKNYHEQADCLVWQGVILGRMGNLAKACEYFEKAKISATLVKQIEDIDALLIKHCKATTANRKFGEIPASK